MMQKKKRKMTETLANGYSSESPQRELSNEYQHDKVSVISQISKYFCAIVLWVKVAVSLEGLGKYIVPPIN